MTIQSKISALDELPYDLYSTPEDEGGDKQVWSLIKDVAPYSFMDHKLL